MTKLFVAWDLAWDGDHRPDADTLRLAVRNFLKYPERIDIKRLTFQDEPEGDR